MSRIEEMRWEGSPNFRWRKRFKGTRYSVSCSDLGIPERDWSNKEKSRKLANEWWRSKLAELTTERIDVDRIEAISELQTKIDYAAAVSPELLDSLEKTKARIIQNLPDELILDDDVSIRKNLEIAQLMGITVPPDTDPQVLQHFFGDSRIWQERLHKFKKTEVDKTIGFHLDRFLIEVQIPQKPATYREVSRYLNDLTNSNFIWSRASSVDDVSESTVTKHYNWLSKKNLDPQQHNKKLGFFRRFANWLWTEHLIEHRPRNLLLKSHRKKIRHKEIRTFENVKSTIDALAMPQKLWGLLCLNCGMTQADLGVASWDQIDQVKWILTRRRTKTGENPDTPTVRYKLWDETIKQLRMLPHRNGLLFTTKNGSPLYLNRFDSKGKPKIKDLFSSYWRDLDPKPEIPLGKFRSIATTALKKDKLYRQYVDYFLAHTAEKLSDVHYGREDDGQFFEALEFVREHVLA